MSRSCFFSSIIDNSFFEVYNDKCYFMKGEIAMKKHANIKLISLLVVAAIFVVFSVLVSLHSHECVGDDCRVCQIIDSVRRILGTCLPISLLCAHVNVEHFTNSAIGVHNKRFESLVAQGVKITS